MATRQEQIAELYQSKLGRAADPQGLQFWADSGLSVDEIGQSFDSIISDRQATIDRVFQEQLGRGVDPSGGQYYLSQLDQGLSEADLLRTVNQSLEGQNFDTQLITSIYRQNLARNPEQEGYQFWLSAAQQAGLTPAEIEATILDAARQAEQVDRGIVGQTFTEMQLADLEADPYGGRYATNSIYDLLGDAVNVSTIGDRQAQFVSPVTQRPVISSNVGTFTATAGLDVLNTPAVQAAIQRAVNSGAMTPEEYRTLYADVGKATNMNEVYAAFNKPQAQVVVDALYGQQTGEANTMAQARAEAAQRQAVLSAQDPGFYQGNLALADAYRAAGLDFPFGTEAFSGYDTRTGQANVVNDQNFNAQIGNLTNTLYNQFGGDQDMLTPLTGQYYSESGLQPGYTPPGAPGTMFRSGVAGYTPNLPTMFRFGAPPVDASFQQYRPGAFQPAGVTTGGFITGYTADGQPIYSEYNNPSQNVVIPTQMQAAQQAYDSSGITQNNFNAAAYLAANPDVARAGVDPYGHYMSHGRNEGRAATKLPFTYVQPSQLVNPSANLQTIGTSATGMNQTDFNAMMANYQAQQAAMSGG